MSFTEWPIPGPYRNASGGPVDPYYFFRVSEITYRPYSSLAEAIASVPVADRDGRVVNILGIDNWWAPGATANEQLLVKSNGTAFTTIALNQYSIHPAFSSQAALNAYLLGGRSSSGPTVTSPTFTGDNPTVTGPIFTAS